MRDYSTRVVVFGTTILGFSAGVVGSFTLLRKRALMGDALSHATLPGIGLAFLIATRLGFDGKSLPILLLGATITGMCGVGIILMLRKYTRIKEDAALSIVLSVFFGAGIATLVMIQNSPHGNAAGLESFIDGKTASMIAKDARLIAIAGAIACGLCLLAFKELKLLCFDEAFAGAEGYSLLTLDVLLMCGVVLITIVGLQAVGLILVIALLVTPAAAARFWTHKLHTMLIVSSCIGAASGFGGAIASAFFPNLPSGAIIVLVATFIFLISMFLGPARGVIPRTVRRNQLNRKVLRQHLLRGIFELIDSKNDKLAKDLEQTSVSFTSLLAQRSWTAGSLRSEIQRAFRDGLLEGASHNAFRLTSRGHQEAAKATREHRLWELYLITYAEIAPSAVDRGADAIEHVLEPEIIEKLEDLLAQKSNAQRMPSSPHPL